MKVVVYAICKNEEQFVDRWYESVKEADEIYVLDTGSTDRTIDLLKKHEIHVKKKIIKPWRFDVARNESLKMVPKDTDICICLDLDEVIEKGWRNVLEKIWKENTNRLKYIYHWSIDNNGKPQVTFYSEKIHSRNNYQWVNPVHEILEYLDNNENSIITDDIVVKHYPDNNKSRSNYLSLLELAVKENPNNDRNVHYLGREYMYYDKNNEAIDMLIYHLSLPSAVWKDERSASMRFIARCYKKMKRYEESKLWLDKAICETPYLRDPFVERAILEYELNNYNGIIFYGEKALDIKTHQKTYINEVFSWNETIYDLLSLAYYYTGDYDNSLKNIKIAVSINPKDKRLRNNKKLIQKKLINTN